MWRVKKNGESWFFQLRTKDGGSMSGEFYTYFKMWVIDKIKHDTGVAVYWVFKPVALLSLLTACSYLPFNGRVPGPTSWALSFKKGEADKPGRPFWGKASWPPCEQAITFFHAWFTSLDVARQSKPQRQFELVKWHAGKLRNYLGLCLD